MPTKGMLVRHKGAYLYDDPYMRVWVILTTLPDIGKTLSVLHLPAEA